MTDETSDMDQGKPIEITEEDSYLLILNKDDFFNFISIVPTDKQRKFFRSVMDGNVKFVKNALNQGSIRKDQALMRTAVNLACRFGQPQVLDTLIAKLNQDFFQTDNLSFVMVMIAGVCEAKRLKTIEEPSGVLDVLIKYGEKSFDKKAGKYISGKIDFETPKLCEGKINTAFMQLCGINDKQIEKVVKILIDSEVVDVNKVYGETLELAGVSPLKRALFTGTKEVVKIILDKMTWKNYRDLGDFDQNHIQRLLGDFIYDFSDPSMLKKYPLLVREDRLDMMELLIEKCFSVTEENKLGHNNDTFMESYKDAFSHDHFDAMIFHVIEEGRRMAHVNGKITWYDIVTKKEDHKNKYKVYTILDDDQMERYYRTLGEEIKEKYKTTPIVDYKPGQCWSCGSHEPDLLKWMKCVQCQQARYCDALCQDEHWSQHQAWCHQQKEKMDRVCDGKSKKRMRKRATKVLNEEKARNYY